MHQELLSAKHSHEGTSLLPQNNSVKALKTQTDI